MLTRALVGHVPVPAVRVLGLRGPVVEAWVVLASLAIEAAVGYPAALHAWVPHPVVWVGNAISALERLWNRQQYTFAVRRLLGCVAVVLVAGVAALAGLGLQWLVGVVVDAVAGGTVSHVVGGIGGSADGVGEVVSGGPALGAGGAAATSGIGGSLGPTWVHVAGSLVIAIVGTTGLAQRSLFDHVNNVLTSLRAGDLAASRERVSLIVGRDTRQLDATGVSAAALESLAESFNDGIVAPAFWFLIAGLPGLFAYKVLNTADSLIGHKEERWRAFGWAAARADDVANLLPARIAGALLVFAGMRGLGVMFSDASKHDSPNAGWPEAAMAGALGIRLGGPATYDGVFHQRPVFGTGPLPRVAELARGLRIYVVACGLLWLAIGIVGVADVAMGSGVVWPH
jgi:adenosylcobinamide-phosphate synthase